MSQQTTPHSFITYLESLAEDRAALAILRRGLGQSPGTVPDMFSYVIPYLPADLHPGCWEESSYFLIAALYALHPCSASGGNLGDHFGCVLESNPYRNKAAERRFTTLLAAHPQDMHHYLRPAISFLKSKGVAVNWHRLMWDLRAWGYPDRQNRVQKQWASRFWRWREK